MTKITFKWNSIVSYEETYIDGKSQGIRVISKFTTEPKEQKNKYSKKKPVIEDARAEIGEVIF